MIKKRIHIVCFDIPYPANYGGAIDVYYRIRTLHQAGVQIVLHCTYKGELTHYAALEGLCEKVYYYPRHFSWTHLWQRKPMAVAGRDNEQILVHLLEDDAPILYEGLVSCGTMAAPELRERKKYFRECNVEHDYYRALAAASHSWRDKLYYRVEAARLQRFENVLRLASGIFALAHQDEAHFVATYPNVPIIYLPCFHANEQVCCPTGRGTGILYHGNLRVAENQKAAEYIIHKIAPLLTSIPFVIAGIGAETLSVESQNVILVPSPTEEELAALIREAQVHLLVTFQGTGLKLKLLNVLYEGRHVVCNEPMVCGTELANLCHVENSPAALVQCCKQLYEMPFQQEDQKRRKQQLTYFDNAYLSTILLKNITNED